MNKDKEYRFNMLGGQWYVNTLNDLFSEYEEAKKKDDDCHDVIKRYLDLEDEYKEWKKWVKKEVKRRQEEALYNYIHQISV